MLCCSFRYFQLAETSSPKAVMEPGYNYCKGLHNRWGPGARQAGNLLGVFALLTLLCLGTCHVHVFIPNPIQVCGMYASSSSPNLNFSLQLASPAQVREPLSSVKY